MIGRRRELILICSYNKNKKNRKLYSILRLAILLCEKLSWKRNLRLKDWQGVETRRWALHAVRRLEGEFGAASLTHTLLSSTSHVSVVYYSFIGLLIHSSRKVSPSVSCLSWVTVMEKQPDWVEEMWQWWCVSVRVCGWGLGRLEITGGDGEIFHQIIRLTDV